MIYLITYDRNKLFANYDNLENAIKSSGSSWWHHMQNTWLLNSTLSANDIYNRLAPHLNVEDRIIIFQVTGNYQGWLDKEAWDWINNQFGNHSGFSNPTKFTY